ncbi:AMP-binding protein [Azospirillum sp. A29]|uniref:phenylacetate--CoA ligase family protein n=1 Tax=Azospirillum sp. A29 TaxID=3160606 RepID=UPI00366F9F71
MPTSDLLHPDFETLSDGEIRALQDRLWTAQWDYVSDRSAMYRRMLPASIGRPVTLDGLQDLPLTDKEDLRAGQEASYPFGDYVACAEESIVRLHRTSGTTGRALNLANSRQDCDRIATIGGRAMHASGLRSTDRVVHCLNYCMWTGGVTDHMTLEAAGATVVPFGVGNTKQLLQTIIDLKITAISCTPSYPALLEKLLRDEGGPAPRDLGLRLGLFGGEAGLDNAAFRATMEETWGFGVRNANYGLSEVLSTLGSQCEATTDLHFHGSDYLFAEILDAEGNHLPIREGTVGELVCTHIEKECQPLIRYRTRDVVTVTGTGRCACGRTSWRFRVSGRTDDMFNVRGINVFPSAVRKAVSSLPALSSGHFRIRLVGPGPYDRIQLRVEAAEGLPETAWPAAAAELEKAVRDQAGATASVTMIPRDTLPRTAGKTDWIERVAS